MKKILALFTTILITATLWAQSPEKMSYQAVIRDLNGNLIKNQSTGIQISILQSSPEGMVTYRETHLSATNSNGLVSLEIGTGNNQEGDFSEVDWTQGPYFIRIETDPAGGTNYTLTGTSQLLSVPFALHAKTAGKITSPVNETDPVFTSWDKTEGISITESQINDLGSYIKNESDPVFEESVAGGITSADTSKWNQKPDNFTENDPVYASSAASNITPDDIEKLSQLSGVNTGDQDLSIYASKNALLDSVANLRAIIPTVKTYAIGDFAQGGVVFWVDESGQHGLACAIEDQNEGEDIPWYNGTNTDTEAHGSGIYAGEMNTALIIANQGSDLRNYAAGICAVYYITGEDKINYGDWYLPSVDELKIFIDNKSIINATLSVHGGSPVDDQGTFYWSSTEYTTGLAGTSYHLQNYSSKSVRAKVRAIRRF